MIEIKATKAVPRRNSFMAFFLNFFKIMRFLNKEKTCSGRRKAEYNSGKNKPPRDQFFGKKFGD
jgi:hypothetical protein